MSEVKLLVFVVLGFFSLTLTLYKNPFSIGHEEHCPTIRFIGANCNNGFDNTLFNQKQIVWDPDAMNAFEYEIPVDDNMGENTFT